MSTAAAHPGRWRSQAGAAHHQGMTTVTAQRTKRPPYVLTAHDRCDRCSARAYVAAHLEAGDLTFCAHHFAKYEAALAATGCMFTDERERLNEL